MKIIFINRFFFPDHSATSQLLTDLSIHLTEGGFDVMVLTSRLISDNSLMIQAKASTLQGVEIVRLWTSRFGRQRLWGRAIDYSTFYLSALWCLLRMVRAGDVVIAKTDPPLISVVAAVVTKWRGAVLMNWIQDLFPEVASALAVQGSGWLERPLRTLRNRSLMTARRNVVIGEGMARKLREEGIPSDRIKVIHNWADGRTIQPVDREKNELRREWDLDDKFVVGYSGNFGRAHEFDTILSAAEILRDLIHVTFLFIGDGAHVTSMKRTVERKNLGNVIFKPYQPRTRLSVSLSVPDLHLISLLPSLEGLIVPSKFYGIAAAGRPMLYIGTTNGEIPQLIRREQCGFSVELHHAQETADVIAGLAQDESTCRRLGNRARSLFDHRFEKSYAMENWRREIAQATLQA
jgi:glycosyltransferase involved in cell wall biosynthesis